MIFALYFGPSGAEAASADEAQSISSWVQTAVLTITLVFTIVLVIYSFQKERKDKRLDHRNRLYEEYAREGVALLEDKHFLATGYSSMTFVRFDLICGLLQVEMERPPVAPPLLRGYMKNLNDRVKYNVPAPTPEEFLSDSRRALYWVRMESNQSYRAFI